MISDLTTTFGPDKVPKLHPSFQKEHDYLKSFYLDWTLAENNTYTTYRSKTFRQIWPYPAVLQTLIESYMDNDLKSVSTHTSVKKTKTGFFKNDELIFGRESSEYLIRQGTFDLYNTVYNEISYNTGSWYAGYVKHNKAETFGIYISDDGRYEGQWHQEHFHGLGTNLEWK